MSARHSWSQPNRPDHTRSERVCWTCALVKVTRHEGGRHWIEFWRGGHRVHSRGTPACAVIPATGEGYPAKPARRGGPREPAGSSRIDDVAARRVEGHRSFVPDLEEASPW